MTKNGSNPLDIRVVALREQISCELAGEAVILNFKDGSYYGLNDVAALVWKLVQEPITLGEVLESLLEAYDVDADDCTRDLVSLIEQLKEWNLIEVQDA